MTFPIEASPHDVLTQTDTYVTAIFSVLGSEFLVLPRGAGFIEYPAFEQGYEALKRATDGFTAVTAAVVLEVVAAAPISLTVLRTMLGFTPPEWAHVAKERSGIEIDQGFARALDRRVRLQPLQPLGRARLQSERVRALVEVACQILTEGAPEVGENQLHRLDKADTKNGTDSLGAVARLGVPYAMLLYERFLGRPFAGHRDAVSGPVGASLETAVEDVLSAHSISYRKTKRAERIPGFDQAPDFIIPSEFNPQIIIEAKIAEDDGTARDKITRIQHLAELSSVGQPPGQPRYEVVACIAGRGFKIRREDMKKLLIATGGKVFTLQTLDQLVQHTRLQEYSSGLGQE